MPILDRAKEREARKLAMHGMNPDGTPIDDKATGPKRGPRLQTAPEPGDEDDDDDLVGDPPPRDDDDDDDTPATLKAQVQQLRRDLAAVSGRTAPAQQAADQYKTLWETERNARQAETTTLQQERDELRAKLENRSTEESIEELLTEDEKRDIDPAVLKVVAKIADALAQRRAPKTVDARGEAIKVLDERDAQRVVQHRNNLMTDPAKGLHKLNQLAFDPKFIAWSKEDDNDVEAVMSSFLAAKSTEEVDRYGRIVAKRVKGFLERDPSRQQHGADPRGALSHHMRRTEQPRITEEQRSAKLREAKTLSRSRSPADRVKAQAILDEVS